MAQSVAAPVTRSIQATRSITTTTTAVTTTTNASGSKLCLCITHLLNIRRSLDLRVGRKGRDRHVDVLHDDY